MQGTVWLTFWIYFRRIIFKHKERLQEKGPLIIISNHPNTLIDPLMALYKVPSICHLLANYGLFKNPIANFLLTNLFCIPVQRVTDVPEGQPLKNDNAFKKAHEHLIKGGNLYIAIEGTSWPERMIRPFKTGTARIAFGAEVATDFNLDLRILPVAITYFDPLKFRKDVYVEVGEPISVDKWREEYEKEPRKVIQNFTDFLEENMRQLTIDCKNVEEDNFLKKLEMLLQNETPLNTEGVYERSKKLLKKLHEWQINDVVTFNSFQNAVESYFKTLKNNYLQDVNATKYSFLNILKLIVTLPIALIGILSNIIPAWLSDKMIAWLKIHEAYDTTVRYVSGLIFFPLFWWLQFKMIGHFWQNHFWGWLYLATVVLTGIVAWWFYKEGGKFVNVWRYKNMDRSKELSTQRQNIMAQLNPYKD